MIDDRSGKKLHHRLSLGEKLTEDEQAQLTAWYKKHDAVEGDLLRTSKDQVDLEALQLQVEETFHKLTAVTEQIQQTTKENNQIRQEITNLRRQLGRRKQVV